MKVYKETIRKYYKYSSYEATDSPIFTGNTETEGVSFLTGGNNYSITSANSGTTISKGQTITFDMGENCSQINSIGFIGVVVGGRYPGALMNTIQCSEDNFTWTTISSNFGGRGDYLTNPLKITSPNNYRYIRFTSDVDDSRYSYGGMYRVTVNYQKAISEESSSSDYDYYEDINKYKIAKETERKYYKYADTKDTLLNLINSNNSSYIDSNTKHFVVNSVTAWNTTQVYTLNNALNAKDVTLSFDGWIQGNSGWTVKITANNEAITLLQKDFGYNITPSGSYTIDLTPYKQITSVKIYVNCYRRSDQYCFGNIDIGFVYTDRKINETTSSDYDYFEDVNTYYAFNV